VGLSHLGTNDFLRMRLRTHLNSVKADDMEIKKEGLDVLTDDELRGACRARGMSAPFGSGCTELMRKNMSDWMELSLERCAPSLIWCRR
jgi:LETM1 and EF-hand domain-containing protein 1